MTTILVKHSHFTDGETEAQEGELAQGPRELLLDSRLKPALNSLTSCRRDSKGLCQCRHMLPWGLGKQGRSGSWGESLGHSLKKGLQVSLSFTILG